MKTKEKILETLLKIQEIVESIADNQHRQEYDFTRDQTGNGNDLKPVNKKPFPKYWWTYTEGLPDVIKDWFVENHRNWTEWQFVCEIIGFGSCDGMSFSGDDFWALEQTDTIDKEYVTHQQIIDHYGLEVNPKGLPESWCIDIRVDDPRVEGFKEWFKIEAYQGQKVRVGEWGFYGKGGINGGWDNNCNWFAETEIDKPQVITLDQFEQLSGVNLMDYTKKEEVKIEPDEQPKKLYTKEDVVNLYDRYLLSDNQPAYSFARWLRDNL